MSTNISAEESLSSKANSPEKRLLGYFSAYLVIRNVQEEAKQKALVQQQGLLDSSGSGKSGQGKTVLKRTAITNTSKGSKGVIK